MIQIDVTGVKGDVPDPVLVPSSFPAVLPGYGVGHESAVGPDVAGIGGAAEHPAPVGHLPPVLAIVIGLFEEDRAFVPAPVGVQKIVSGIFQRCAPHRSQVPVHGGIVAVVVDFVLVVDGIIVVFPRDPPVITSRINAPALLRDIQAVERRIIPEAGGDAGDVVGRDWVIPGELGGLNRDGVGHIRPGHADGVAGAFQLAPEVQLGKKRLAAHGVLAVEVGKGAGKVVASEGVGVPGDGPACASPLCQGIPVFMPTILEG